MPNYETIAAGILGILLLVAIVAAIIAIKDRMDAQKYIFAVEKRYHETDDVLLALRQGQYALPSDGHRERAVKRAIKYINCSIIRDYKTAFRMINGAFYSKRVKLLHAEMLENESRKKRNLLLLCAPENTNQ